MKAWSLKELKFIKNNLHLTDEELGKHLGRKAGQVNSARGRYKIKKPNNGKFEAGRKAHNKGKNMPIAVYKKCKPTMFKIGGEPANKKYKMYDVYEWKCRDKRYKYIKTPDRSDYPYQRWVWEQTTGIKLKPNEVICFKDGNSLNVVFMNLFKITKTQKMRMAYSKEKVAISLRKTWSDAKLFRDLGIPTRIGFANRRNKKRNS